MERNPIVKNFDGGAKELTRPDGRPVPLYVRWPLMTLESMSDLQDKTRLTIFNVVNEYFIAGKTVVPVDAVESAMPMVRMAINATEEELDRQAERSKTNSRSANERWGNTGEELESINYPPVSVPPKMKGWTLTRGKADISIGEILEYSCIFFLRGYKPDELPHFLMYWGKKNWNEGAIMGREGRLNRAQRWKLKDGRAYRFANDAPALAFFTSFLWALPEDKRVYLLSEKVSIAVSEDQKVALALPVEIADFLSQDRKVKEALNAYHKAHGLKPGHCSLVIIPFSILIR